MTNILTTSGVFGRLLSDPDIAAEFAAPAFTRRMLDFEAAWTQALAASGVVAAENAAAALTAIETYAGGSLAQDSDRDGLPVPGLVARLKDGLEEDAAKAVHTGATSQDVIDTAMMLTCLSVMDQLTARLGRIVHALDQLLAQFGDAPLMARTRMQAALPSTTGSRVDAWRRPLLDHLKRADAIKAELATVQVGGPIGLRDVPQDHVDRCAAHVAETLGLALGPVWHTDRSRLISFGHWLTLVSGSLGKIGQDVALMAQQGLDEIKVSGGGSSSAMAHKENPIAAELMVTLARYVAGLNGTLGLAMVHEQERSGTAWALEWLTLPAMAEATGAALAHSERLLTSIERIGQPD